MNENPPVPTPSAARFTCAMRRAAWLAVIATLGVPSGGCGDGSTESAPQRAPSAAPAQPEPTPTPPVANREEPEAKPVPPANPPPAQVPPAAHRPVEAQAHAGGAREARAVEPTGQSHLKSAEHATSSTARAAPPLVQPASPLPPCGEEGQPSCPLQAWMEQKLQDALEREDFPRLARALGQAAAFAPNETWNAGAQGWSTIAREGAAAASAGDAAATEASCKTCHKTWRKRYRQEYRQRPLAP